MLTIKSFATEDWELERLRLDSNLYQESNRKAIKWKNACAGLGFQLILAICILKLAWVQNIFEFAGRVFIKILDFTMEGTSFLFAPLGSNQIGDQLLTPLMLSI